MTLQATVPSLHFFLCSVAFLATVVASEVNVAPSRFEVLEDLNAVELIQTQISLDALDVHCPQDEDEDWLFILSTGRSGSTSALAMVNMIPGYFLGGENNGIMTAFMELNDDYDRQQEEVLYHTYAWRAGNTSSAERACALRAYTKSIIGSTDFRPTTTGFKEIRHWQSDELDMFLQIFPNSRFIINTRLNFTGQSDSTKWIADEETLSLHTESLNNWGHTHSNRTFFLPLESFSVERFNEMLDWLGVASCRYTNVAHLNDGEDARKISRSSPIDGTGLAFTRHWDDEAEAPSYITCNASRSPNSEPQR